MSRTNQLAEALLHRMATQAGLTPCKDLESDPTLKDTLFSEGVAIMLTSAFARYPHYATRLEAGIKQAASILRREGASHIGYEVIPGFQSDTLGRVLAGLRLRPIQEPHHGTAD